MQRTRQTVVSEYGITYSRMNRNEHLLVASTLRDIAEALDPMPLTTIKALFRAVMAGVYISADAGPAMGDGFSVPAGKTGQAHIQLLNKKKTVVEEYLAGGAVSVDRAYDGKSDEAILKAVEKKVGKPVLWEGEWEDSEARDEKARYFKVKGLEDIEKDMKNL